MNTKKAILQENSICFYSIICNGLLSKEVCSFSSHVCVLATEFWFFLSNAHRVVFVFFFFWTKYFRWETERNTKKRSTNNSDNQKLSLNTKFFCSISFTGFFYLFHWVDCVLKSREKPATPVAVARHEHTYAHNLFAFLSLSPFCVKWAALNFVIKLVLRINLDVHWKSVRFDRTRENETSKAPKVVWNSNLCAFHYGMGMQAMARMHSFTLAFASLDMDICCRRCFRFVIITFTSLVPCTPTVLCCSGLVPAPLSSQLSAWFCSLFSICLSLVNSILCACGIFVTHFVAAFALFVQITKKLLRLNIHLIYGPFSSIK